MANNETAEPEWTEAEHAEIMRLHIVEGYTISSAKWFVYQKLDLGRKLRLTQPSYDTEVGPSVEGKSILECKR